MEPFPRNIQTLVQEDNCFVVKYEIKDSNLDVHCHSIVQAQQFYEEILKNQEPIDLPKQLDVYPQKPYNSQEPYFYSQEQPPIDDGVDVWG